MLQQSAKDQSQYTWICLQNYMPEKLDNNKLQAGCPAALWQIKFCSFCRGHFVHLSQHMRTYKYTQLHSHKLASAIGFLVRILLVNAFNGPALTSLTAIKMHNRRVELLQCWSMSNRQHCNATLHACAIQLHLPICTHLQKCIRIDAYVMTSDCCQVALPAKCFSP